MMKQNTGRKLLGVLLALVLVIGLVPGMGLTAYAEPAYGAYLVTSSDTTSSLPDITVKMVVWLSGFFMRVVT